MADRPSFTAKEATELAFLTLLESDGESDIEEDPEFLLPTFDESDDIESDGVEDEHYLDSQPHYDTRKPGAQEPQSHS